MTISTPALRIGALIIAATLVLAATAAAKDPKPVPDFTQGAKLPKGAKHD